MNVYFIQHLDKDLIHFIHGGYVYLPYCFFLFQLKLLSRKSARGVAYDDVTLQGAMRLWLVDGSRGYMAMRQQGYLLPSLRTLRRKISVFKFEPGILHDVLKQFVHPPNLLIFPGSPN